MMLTLYDFANRRRHSRRDFLRIGSLGLGGLTLPHLLAQQAAGSEGGGGLTGKSVIFLFMHGGPSQIETFDPKMTAPSEIRSTTGEISTTLPGITFGSTFTKLAQLTDYVSIVRSFTTGDSRHDIKPIVSKSSLDANLGSIFARVAGGNDPETGMPTNCALYPQAVDATTRPTTHNFGKFNSAGALGGSYAPFEPGQGGDLQQDMELNVPLKRLDDRRTLLAQLDRLRFGRDVAGVPAGGERLREQAFDTILGGVAEAFDISKEDPKTIARYDTSKISTPENISKTWNNYNNYVDNGKSLGKLLLLARRLCERGCGFVTITTNFVWDMHADQNNAGVVEGMQYMGLPFDNAVSAFIEDVRARGLEQDILLVCCGEMGRTPKINKRGGRDHWGNLAPLLLSGGGLGMGRVIGQSTRDVSRPLSEPVTNDHLISTIMHTLFDVDTVRTTAGVPTDIARMLAAHAPIAGL